MPRSLDDSWDIATSVGATAVMFALARMAETASDEPLIRTLRTGSPRTAVAPGWSTGTNRRSG
ncbi:hypothetical protein A5695_17395 [Mycobacterium sp. E1747]|nr:hypothetical protein A5695_17395 [Mycobacterium sp. E1747]